MIFVMGKIFGLFQVIIEFLTAEELTVLKYAPGYSLSQ